MTQVTNRGRKGYREKCNESETYLIARDQIENHNRSFERERGQDNGDDGDSMPHGFVRVVDRTGFDFGIQLSALYRLYQQLGNDESKVEIP